MTSTLIEVIDRLAELDNSDRFNPLVIYADGGSEAAPQARAVVCPGDEEGSPTCPLDSALSEVLMVFLAQEAIEVWSAWRGGRIPSRMEKYEAVMFYSLHDAYMPTADDASQLIQPSPQHHSSEAGSVIGERRVDSVVRRMFWHSIYRNDIAFTGKCLRG